MADYTYLKKAKLEFTNKWTINGEEVNLVITRALAYFNQNQVMGNNNAFDYYNVKNCCERLQNCETYSNVDIIRSWLDMFIEYVSVAIYLDSYRGIQDTEKVKVRAAELSQATFQKMFV